MDINDLALPSTAASPASPSSMVRLPPLAALISPRLEPSTPTPLAVTIRLPQSNDPPSRDVSTPVESKNVVVSSSPVSQGQKRKRVNDARKQESIELMKEVQELEDELMRLKRKTMDTTTSSPSPDMKQLKLRTAYLGSMLFPIMPFEMATPLHSYIHLGCHMEDRRRTILDIKPEQLRLGRQLVEQRSEFMDITHPHSSNEWYTSDDGDICGLHFYVEQLFGLHNVQRAFAAAVGYITSYKVCAQRAVSVMTYHEDVWPPTHSSNLQLRMLIHPSDGGPVLEANTLLFAKYDPDENVAIIVGNYVDKDDLRPYEPTKRVRHEVSTVFVLSPSPVGVIMRQWLCERTHFAPHLLDPADFGYYVHENPGHSVESLFCYVREQVLPAENTTTTTKPH